MLTKNYDDDDKTCNVTFAITHEPVREAQKVALVGEFNGWDTVANPMIRCRDGGFATNIRLCSGSRYQFRYLIDGHIWENDAAADGYVPTHYGDCDNSVVSV